MSARARASTLAVVLGLALAVTACGSGSRASTGPSGRPIVADRTADVEGTVTMIQTAFPNSLDPQDVVSPQAQEATWEVYTGLVTYAHRSGSGGATLIPGLAEKLPAISDGGRTYTVTLRPHLTYSDGSPVLASDFLYSLERAVKLPWPGAKALVDPYVRGARAFLVAAPSARTITGVSYDDSTGRIVIHLTRPDPGFDATLAQPALGLVPPRAPLGPLPPHAVPLPGCGPYVITHVVPGRSYELTRNPHFRALPGIPAGSVNVEVRISANLTAGAEAVLNNTDDLLDWTRELPSGVQSQVQQLAGGRFLMETVGDVTDYIFLDQTTRPFSSPLVRQAVVVALGHDQLDTIANGALAPGCFLLVPSSPASPNGRCPYAVTGAGNLALARALVSRAGRVGQPVVVWSPTSQPQLSWMTSYTQMLNRIGLRARLRPLPAGKYPMIIGEPQIGLTSGLTGVAQYRSSVADFSADPVGAYGQLLAGNQFSASGATNLGQIDDPRLNGLIDQLGAATTPAALNAQWQKTERYVARQADVAVIGYQKFPFFTSARMDDAALVVSPVYGWDFTSLQLRR